MKPVVTIVGFAGSGKGGATRFLVERGFISYSGGGILRKVASGIDLEPTRDNLIALGNKFRAENDGAILMRDVIPLLERISVDPRYLGIVVESLRNPDEVQFLKDRAGSLVLEIWAPEMMRFDRILKRKKLGDPENWYEFVGLEAIDHGYGQKETGQNIAGCVQLADAVIRNDSTPLIFKSSLETVLTARGIIEGESRRERF